MNNELKPTWNYILNDLALYSLLIKVAYSEDVTKQDKVDLEHQIKLLQQKVNQLEEEKANEHKKYERLLFQTRICIRFIKEGNKTKETESCKDYHHCDFALLLEILERECSNE